MREKYSIAELEKLDVLPADVNAEAERYAAAFQNAELMGTMRQIREKKLGIKRDGFGEITMVIKNNPVAIFAFQAGICKHLSIMQWISDKVVFKESIKFYH